MWEGMSGGNTHESINFNLISFFSICLIFFGIAFIKPWIVCVIFLLECCLFWAHAMFHTYYVTPDNDTHSKSTKRLGLSGIIIDFIFPHHGLLHNPFFWVLSYIGIYVYILRTYDYSAWFLTGGTLALLLHILVDDISHTWKVLWGKVKRKLNPLNWI